MQPTSILAPMDQTQRRIAVEAWDGPAGYPTLDEIEQWLCTLKASLNTQMRLGHRMMPAFSKRERQHIKDIDAQYDDRIWRGFDVEPLTRSQVNFVYAMYTRLALITANEFRSMK